MRLLLFPKYFFFCGEIIKEFLYICSINDSYNENVY